MTNEMTAADDTRIAVIGLGYVGLPLAVEFGKTFPTVGFDIKPERLQEIREGRDSTREVSVGEFSEAVHLSVTSELKDLAECNVYVVTVPTPIDRAKRPDLRPLERASDTVGQVLKPGDLVIYESTVYPGATEEICVPILERVSGLQFNEDFFVGYSPERINPGDTERRLPNIVKVTSGSTPEAADRIDALYQAIIPAGTHKAESIRVAEAAKVIENTQRDLNIGLMNELAIIFNKLGIDTEAVLKAAGTKWNFLPFRPGLVGGHCIGVDPYYLTFKAEQVGHHPQIILSGRRINDGMGAYVAGQLVKAMIKRRIHVEGARVLVMGLTFKENCPDLRNTRVIDVIRELEDFGMVVDVHDPWVDPGEGLAEFGIEMTAKPSEGAYDAIVLAVAHAEFRNAGAKQLRQYGRSGHTLYDLKHVLSAEESDLRL
ncbi:Vi polysaccharide biosynthesis UDP-N-acetylglucosamine C-6 dehydrogenase TviB [Marimonas sp. MJW-29]|uniref:Vi polysaccharide biosynthesis UDP-N-acetylglucosamine C-6 dehydrogenase TviB n=1 Tax=Sulfitobacter sediminis TaxID=3234186 RepID=A0ABV3RPT8_9RHOB